MIAFTIMTVPVAQPRHRDHVLVDKNGCVIKGKSGSPIIDHYIPKDNPVHMFKYQVAVAARQAVKEPFREQPLILGARFYLARPGYLDALVGRAPNKVHKFAAGPLRCYRKPDLDNLLKSLKDAMLGIAWKDDSLVCEYAPGTGKYYHERGGVPRVEVTIDTLDMDPEQSYDDGPDRHPEYEENEQR